MSMRLRLLVTVFTVCGLLLNAPAALAQAGLVAAYSFDEGSGSIAADASGNTNTGAVGSGLTWTPAGRFGNALVFNGSAAVTIPNSSSLGLTSSMTLEAWVYPTVVNAAWRDVIYKGDDIYYLEATSDRNRPVAGGKFGTGNSSTESYGTAALAVNTWTHLAATYDGATLRLYVNGVLVASKARTGSLASSTNPLQIGGDSLYGQYFVGRIDEVRVYNVARTAVEIQTDMGTPLGVVTPVPDLTIAKAHTGAFSQGQMGATYTLTASNVGSLATTGTVTVSDTLPERPDRDRPQRAGLGVHGRDGELYAERCARRRRKLSPDDANRDRGGCGARQRDEYRDGERRGRNQHDEQHRQRRHHH